MKTKKLQSLEKYREEEIKSSEIFGGWDGILGTGPGEFAGMSYTSDFHFDDNGDNLVSVGESIVFHWTPQPGKI